MERKDPPPGGEAAAASPPPQAPGNPGAAAVPHGSPGAARTILGTGEAEGQAVAAAAPLPGPPSIAIALKPRPGGGVLLPPPDSPFAPAPEDPEPVAPLASLPISSGVRLRSVLAKPPGSRPEPLLQAENLNKRFGKREVVKDVNLEVGAGEIVGLLGRNGAGKTTTFRMIMGVLRPDSGQVRFDFRDVTRLPMYQRANKGLGYLAQEPSVFQRMSVEENLLAILELQVMDARARKDRLEELVKELGLGTVRSSKAATLSGGERRRLEIARAMTLKPRIVLFDEPFAGIDPIAVNEIQSIVRELAQKGVGVLVTDHNVRETLTITDRTYIMDEGRIWIQGSPREIVNHPEARSRYLGHDFRLDF